MKIKSISKAVLLLALLTSTSFAAGKNVNVEFRKGHSSAQYSGEIKGYDYDTYTFYAKKGQKVHVSISNEGADTYLFGPGIDDSVDLSRYSPELDSHGQYSLPASGKYELRVLQTRNDARKNKTKKALKIPIPTKMASFEPNRRIPASLKIRGIPPPTAPKKKNRAETAAFVVSSRLMPLEKSTIPAQPPTANHKRKGMDFPGSLKIRLTEVIRRS